jgi:plastocyanin
MVHIGFGHATTSDPPFGDVSYYTGSSTANAPASIVTVAAGSKIVFESDSGQPPHTASGLGSSGFPTTFDNSGGTTATGSTIDGGTTWSTGTLQTGTMSSVFTVGPAGDYYFGCYYHYVSSAMRDVIVSK